MKFGDLYDKIIKFAYDYDAVSKSGIFMHASYARKYFNTVALYWFSLPHYILFGEKRGYRPNPFFDPTYFKQKAGTHRLADYLRQMRLWVFPTSDYFDSRWYIETYSGHLATNENPLQHFWLKGFDAGHSASPRFDIEFFCRAISRDRADRKGYAYEYACLSQPDLPLNLAELEKRQSDFYGAVQLKIIRQIPAPQKRFLLFIQAGNNFTHRYVSATANFDILINYYDDSEPKGDAQYVFRQRGTKTTAIRKLFEECPDVLLGYEAVLFLDDDVIISQQQIEALFEAQSRHQLDLLQASLSAESECYFPVLKQPEAGKGLRRLSGIEVMMPVVSQRALREFSWIFSESISGWGVDTLLSVEVRKRFGNTIGLLSDVVAIHTRPTDTSNNMFYKFLRKHGINPSVEAGAIAMKYELNDKMSAVDFYPDEPNDGAARLGGGPPDRTIALRYSDRLEKATLNYSAHRVKIKDKTFAGMFLLGGRLLTIHWDQMPAESFLKQGNEYIHISESKDVSRSVAAQTPHV